MYIYGFSSESSYRRRRRRRRRRRQRRTPQYNTGATYHQKTNKETNSKLSISGYGLITTVRHSKLLLSKQARTCGGVRGASPSVECDSRSQQQQQQQQFAECVRQTGRHLVVNAAVTVPAVARRRYTPGRRRSPIR